MVYSRLVELTYHTKPTKWAKNHVKYYYTDKSRTYP